MTILAFILIAGGMFFIAVSSLGMIRLPDFYSRTHTVTKSDTLGSIMLLLGLVLYNGWELSSLKLLVIPVFIFIANPTSAHAISRAALRSGLEPWVRPDQRHNNSKEDKQ
jgi:multicomponent Na+:H+ antiporter subunit G